MPKKSRKSFRSSEEWTENVERRSEFSSDVMMSTGTRDESDDGAAALVIERRNLPLVCFARPARDCRPPKLVRTRDERKYHPEQAPP